MTYSILDQSILNWQGIQDWAQKQWLKRQQSLRSNADSVKSRPNPQLRSQTGESERDPNSPTTELTSTTINGPISPLDSPISHQTSGITTHNPPNILGSTLLSSSPQSSPPSPRHLPPNSWNFSQGPLYGPRYLPTSNTVNGRNLSTNHDLPVLHVPVLQNVRRGYETDQASSGFVDATSQSQATAERTRIKLVSETSSSSRQSNTEYVDNGRGWRLFLPFWCRYVAWSLCIMIITTCTVVTILYGFRFGYSKSIMWLQSLYFSFMICVFITQPLMILIIVIYTAITYRNDPSILNHHDDGYYGVRYDGKKKMEEKKNESPSEEFERGVAARQRSRYLRFARPPQEKTLIEARKKRIKEKLACSLFRNCMVQLLLVFCVGFMAYGKDSSAIYNLNTALHKIFLQNGNQSFHSIKTIPEFYSWCQSSLLDNLYDIKTSTTKPEGSYGLRNSYLIGSANLRQLRVRQEPCLSEFAIPLRIMPGVYECRYSYTQQHKSSKTFGPNDIWTWQPAQGGASLWGKYGFYDNSGFVTELNDSRNIASEQIKELEILKWIDRQTRAVVIEFTIYYIPDNLFTCVSLLVELPESGGVFTRPFISSTYLFRYVSTMDKFILAFELLFIVISLHKVKCQLVAMVKEKKKYFTSFWNMIELLMCIVSMVYIGCYIYRYILVSEVVEYFRSTYYQQFINISFICCWNEYLQALIGFVLFLLCVDSVRLLNHNSWCLKAVSFYQRSQRELLLFTLLFGVMVMAYSSAGVALFGTACEGLMGVWSGIFTMVMALTGVYPESDINQSEWTNLFMFTYLVFATGLLSAYVLAVLSRRVKSEKTMEVLQMGVADCLCFLWDKFLINMGIRKTHQKQEPENILPAEFIMAEIEYQVDELLFRMNALSGSSALPDKPRTYFTDSDATQHIVGDDGISTGGSEHDHMLVEGDRLEHRVQRIEDKLCANEPYLAQLLKLDSVGADVLSQEKEKQLRSHLELEIFRQLQLQRQESNDLTDGPLLLTTTDNSGHNTEQSNTLSTGESNNQQDTTWLAGGITGLENLLKLQESLPESSSSSPDSTHDNRGNKQQTHSKQRPIIQLKGCIKTALLEAKNTKRSSSSDNVSPQSSESDKAHARTDSSSGQSSNTGSLTKNTPSAPGIKRKESDKPPLKTASSKTNSPSHSSSISAKPLPKIKPAIPPKPSFMRGSLAELKSSKNSPNLRKLRLAPDRCSVKEAASGHVGESSSGSEQDGGHALKVPAGKRALRKTRSQGRGKGHGEIASAHILGDLETDVFGEEEEEDIEDETQK
ncbi:polycystin-2-like [Patella vulgata]|uniref:polycystin-2-like n=1 Tax=Patella vulgata TaxID=6465 RepID=UPI0024A83508|nr:polycystin-2-like [Patella vulgata]